MIISLHLLFSSFFFFLCFSSASSRIGHGDSFQWLGFQPFYSPIRAGPGVAIFPCSHSLHGHGRCRTYSRTASLVMPVVKSMAGI